MFKEENHQNKKLEQVQKYKKTGRIVTQLLYENHLFGRHIGQRWCCIHAFCYSSIITDDNNEKIIKGPSRHVADEHAISEIEIDVMISFNQLKHNISKNIDQGQLIYDQYLTSLAKTSILNNTLSKYILPFKSLNGFMKIKLSSSSTQALPLIDGSKEIRLEGTLQELGLKDSFHCQQQNNVTINHLPSAFCFGCLKSGHFYKGCEQTSSKRKLEISTSKSICFGCGLKGHSWKSCQIISKEKSEVLSKYFIKKRFDRKQRKTQKADKLKEEELNEKKIKSTSQTLGSSSVKKLDININTAHSKSKCFACGLYGHSWKKCHKERTEEISNNYKSKCMQSRQIKRLKKQSLMNENSFFKGTSNYLLNDEIK